MDRPIIFSAPMVRALLDGRKTQTRRLIEPFTGDLREGDIMVTWPADAFVRSCAKFRPRYAKGDRLYVREHWKVPAAYDDLAPRDLGGEEAVQYLADGVITNRWSGRETHFGKHRQGMHMPRWASRLTLLVDDVRVERLQAISEADAQAEGVEQVSTCGGDPMWKHYPDGSPAGGWLGAADSFRTLWQSLHGPESWDANPFVVAVTFSVVRGNIDTIANPHPTALAKREG